ncbi:MAG: D-alanyl-D-alanine carboxypeptidase family protein [Oscillospiraceae bacterium]|nr:D-alanyl-D-alanine carboxypeptidase family protein [Oscillospiraceae bacterium]
MKYYILAAVMLFALCLQGCAPLAQPEPSTAPPTAPPETTAAPTTVPTEPPTGWLEMNGMRYYRFPDGTHATGWFEDSGKTYYIAPNGFMHTGWLELDGKTYYFQEDGSMAVGEIQIDGVNYHFTADGWRIILVNPWNTVPEDYDPTLVEIPSGLATQGVLVSEECYDALIAMLEACNADTPRAVVVSGHRTHAYQEKLYKNKVSRVQAEGYSYEEALVEAAKVVAIPGTSEHQLGLAVDIVDSRSYSLTDYQATLPAQKWLMEHCWEYGFILRYPADKTPVTGIIYEPWHYRYVGLELAKELYDSGLTLEEYLQNLTQ